MLVTKQYKITAMMKPQPKSTKDTKLCYVTSVLCGFSYIQMPVTFSIVHCSNTLAESLKSITTEGSCYKT